MLHWMQRRVFDDRKGRGEACSGGSPSANTEGGVETYGVTPFRRKKRGKKRDQRDPARKGGCLRDLDPFVGGVILEVRGGLGIARKNLFSLPKQDDAESPSNLFLALSLRKH